MRLMATKSGRHQDQVCRQHGMSPKVILDDQQPCPALNTVSVMMANAMMEPNCRPVMVMTGISVFFRAWPKWMVRALSPRAGRT